MKACLLFQKALGEKMALKQPLMHENHFPLNLYFRDNREEMGNEIYQLL